MGFRRTRGPLTGFGRTRGPLTGFGRTRGPLTGPGRTRAVPRRPGTRPASPPRVRLRVRRPGPRRGGGVLSGVAARARLHPPGRRHPDGRPCRTYVVAPISVPDAAASHTPPWPVPRAVRGVLAL